MTGLKYKRTHRLTNDVTLTPLTVGEYYQHMREHFNVSADEVDRLRAILDFTTHSAGGIYQSDRTARVLWASLTM